MVLPPALRVHFTNGVWVSLSPMDPCLLLQTEKEFIKAGKRLQKKQRDGSAGRNTLRKWTATVVPQNMDSQGRVPIPQELREALQLGTKVMVVGVLDNTEIWSPEDWAAVAASDEGTVEGAWL